MLVLLHEQKEERCGEMSFVMEFIIFIFIIGSMSGSFFNVVGLRVPRGQSISLPRSHCVKCQHTLQWYELVPILSWIFLGGKCRKCKAKISPIYPIMEFLTAILFVCIYLKFGVTLALPFYLLIASMMIIISVSDLDTRLIPDKILGFFLVVVYPLSFFVEGHDWKSQLIGFTLAFALNFLIVLLTKGRGMGGGDVKLFMLLGLLLGWEAFLTIFFLSVIVGLFIGIYAKIKTKESEIPFGPSIAVATLVYVFFGTELINWYSTFFL